MVSFLSGFSISPQGCQTCWSDSLLGFVPDHSNAAHNLLAMLRVGVIEGGYEVEHLNFTDFLTELKKNSFFVFSVWGMLLLQLAMTSTYTVVP